jgi:hypothetical protein
VVETMVSLIVRLVNTPPLVERRQLPNYLERCQKLYGAGAT